MPTRAAAPPPAGFLVLCRRSPQDCVEPGVVLPDLAALEAEAHRRFWADAFGTSSAPAALASPSAPAAITRAGAFDWSTVFGRAAQPRVETAGEGAGDPAFSATRVDLPVANPAEAAISTLVGASNTATAAATADPATEVSAAGSPIDATPAAGDQALAALDPAGTAFSAFAASAADPTPPVAAASAPDTVAGKADAEVEAKVEVGAGPPVVYSLDREGWRLVSRVNRRLNREIRQVSDARLYGVDDFWARPQAQEAQGDCEDYVLAKRAALIAEGVPAAALSIAIVETRWGESHAVLLLASDRGEFVLDSLSPWVTRWDRVDYRWRERQQPGRPFDWVRIAV
jgi:predicted transglutaminase-like cysteine proteinase